MKKIVLGLFLLINAVAYSQTYTNNWIDYSRSYYKLNIGKSGLYQIKLSDLTTMGLSNIPIEQFQLWRNGKEQILYTNKTSGFLSATDFIQFWGELNDGKPDTKLYLKPEYQLSDHFSLQSDTVAYFLTVNPSGNNLRYSHNDNNTIGNVLPPEPYFMNVRGIYFNNKINPGYALPAGDVYVYSSSYDMGEGWTSDDIYPGSPLSAIINNLNVYTSGPNATVNLGMAGSAFNARNVKVSLNGTNIVNETIAYLNPLKKMVNDVPLTLLSGTDIANFSFQNNSLTPTDRVVASHVEIKYPSKWNFNGLTDFYFELPSSLSGNYLEIENFNYGDVAPILFDITNQKSYVGDITSTPGKIKFALPPSTLSIRKFRLVNVSAAAIKTIPLLQKRDFVNYAVTANQGNYLIISNPDLYNDGIGVNNVALYSQYRNSSAGGSYNSKVIDINQLIDQFAFGIKKHPSAIKDFIAFAKNNFTITPKFVFLIGKGITYNEYSKNQKSVYAEKLNLVPTFGSPASDVLLVSPYGSAVPTFPVGRLSAISGEEVGNYLQKVKEYESAQNSTVQTLESKLWMKNITQIVGGKEVSESNLFQGYMNQYKKVIEDTSYGGHTELFVKTSNAAVQLIAGKRIEQLFNEGISILEYFGHSSANTLEFNLSDPNSYSNSGKYPLFFVSGCTAGNNYIFDTLRIIQNNFSISEDFVLAKQRGSIAFLASTHYGIPQYLNDYNVILYKKLGVQNYLGSIGEFIQQTVKDLNGANENTYFFTRADYEENNLHGDPSLKINPHPKPDYVIEEPSIKINPTFISVSEDKFVLDAITYNIGKAVNDSIIFEVKRTYPNGSIDVLLRKIIKAPNYADSIHLIIPII
ncbi:MAG: C25 family cysteine peptidase, partial [Ginsengibacter sp.]